MLSNENIKLLPNKINIMAKDNAMVKIKAALIAVVFAVSLLFCGFGAANIEKKDFIKWVDCNVPYEVLLSAYEYDVRYHNSETVEFDFVEALSYLAVKFGNKFSAKRDNVALSDLVNKLKEGSKISDFYGENKYYLYYVEAYSAIFREYIGEYTDGNGNTVYGLKNYHPIPQGYWYNHYDDFGVSRSYGFRRKHLGHDISGSIGTPVIAVEGGTVTEFGWNRYGGWRIGIRSFDGLRSYYYAHLRKNKPYIEGLEKGDTIKAGQVIGYLGVTGYSYKENTNMKCAPHLHLGIQLIFDESQYQGASEIWIDPYDICRFLSHNRAQVYKEGDDYITKTSPSLSFQ